jgi:signal peptidase I
MTEPAKSIAPAERKPVAPEFDKKTEQTPDEEPPPPRFSKAWCGKMWREQIRPLAVLLIALFSIRSSLADWNVVPTGSMKPTIIEGDRIFVNKLAYDLKVPFTKWHIFEWGNPSRGEIIVFDSPRDGVRLVKRVIGVPGDTIQLINNRLYINGTPSVYSTLDQDTQNQIPAPERQIGNFVFHSETVDHVTHAMMEDGSREHRVYPGTFPAVTVPKGEYFVMGDNRDISADSRFFKMVQNQAPNPSWIGFVPRGNIVGRSSRVIISLNYDNYYIPRGERFFRALP